MVILIVDKSMLVIERIAGLLSETISPLIIHKASSYEQATTVMEKTKPAVILLDSSLPENKSTVLLKSIKAMDIKPVVIIISLHLAFDTEIHSKAPGAHFYLDKYKDFEKIPAIISVIALYKAGDILK